MWYWTRLYGHLWRRLPARVRSLLLAFGAGALVAGLVGWAAGY